MVNKFGIYFLTKLWQQSDSISVSHLNSHHSFCCATEMLSQGEGGDVKQLLRLLSNMLKNDLVH